MFSIANLLDSAKAKAGIETDYRLSKLIEINHSAVTNYRSGRSLPNEAILERLCALSGDDPDLIAAQIQSRRAASEEARQLWQRVAERLMTTPRAIAGHARPIILLVLFAISLVAAHAGSTPANSSKGFQPLNFTSYTSYCRQIYRVMLKGLSIGARYLRALLKVSSHDCTQTPT